MRRLAVLPLLLVLAGCGGSSSPSGVAGPVVTSVSPSSSPTVERPSTAAAMIRALKRRLPAVGGVLIFTARTDTNHLLGRPGGYSSKGAWRDSRVAPSDTPGFTLGDVDVGGGVEVFASRELAVERGGRLQAVGPPIVNEYDFVCGPALLRVSGYLAPSVARQYRHALARVLGVPCAVVT